MHRHVPTIGLLMVILGGLEIALGCLFVPASVIGGLEDNEPVGMVFGIGMGLLLIAIAVLNIVGGTLVRDYRGRTVALVALVAGFATLCTCYCFPWSLGLGVGGLVVLTHPDAIAAFTLRSEGLDHYEILAELDDA